MAWEAQNAWGEWPVDHEWMSFQEAHWTRYLLSAVEMPWNIFNDGGAGEGVSNLVFQFKPLQSQIDAALTCTFSHNLRRPTYSKYFHHRAFCWLLRTKIKLKICLVVLFSFVTHGLIMQHDYSHWQALFIVICLFIWRHWDGRVRCSNYSILH